METVVRARLWLSRVARLAAVTVPLAVAAVATAPAALAAKQLGGFVGGVSGVFAGGYFTEPSDVAMYRGGVGRPRKLFVVEAAAGRNSRVQRLDAHGNFELAWGRDVVRAGVRGNRGDGSEICRRAVSGSGGCKAAPPGSGAGELRMPTAVDVDEATGDVYVMDSGNRRVQRFAHDGRFVAAWGWGVASGGARYEVCTAGCQRGRTGGPEGDANPGQLAALEALGRRSAVAVPTGAIAVGPRPYRHVFVGDEGNDRVLEFTARGQFVRGWGLGVATGEHRFEVCTAQGGCLAGRHSRTGPSRLGHAPVGSWPRHLAVDGNGVVYATEGARDGGVVRFRSDQPPASPNASVALLAPFTVEDLLDGGYNLGLAVDPLSGDLAVARNRFGPMVVDEISDPGAPLGGGPDDRRPRVRVQEGLPYLGSVNGIEAADRAVYIVKSTLLDPNDPDSGEICHDGGRRATCHGLVALVPQGQLAVTLTGAVTTGDGAKLAGAVAAHGIVRYRFQVSRDGRGWRDAAPARYASGAGFTPVSTVAVGLAPNAVYQFRLLASRQVVGAQQVARSARLPVFAPVD